MKSLSSFFFLFEPIRLGRFGFTITRNAVRWQRYRADGLWTSWDWLWFRVYRWDLSPEITALDTSSTPPVEHGPSYTSSSESH